MFQHIKLSTSVKPLWLTLSKNWNCYNHPTRRPILDIAHKLQNLSKRNLYSFDFQEDHAQCTLKCCSSLIITAYPKIACTLHIAHQTPYFKRCQVLLYTKNLRKYIFEEKKQVNTISFTRLRFNFTLTMFKQWKASQFF